MHPHGQQCPFFDQLLDRLVEITISFLRAQINHGARAVQLFDSWAGTLSPADYTTYVLPHSQQVLSALEGRGVPRIHFGVGTGAILRELREAGGDVIGADWRTPLDEAWQRIGPDRAIQGNLDPTLLLGPLDRVFAATDEILARADGRPGSRRSPRAAQRDDRGDEQPACGPRRRTPLI